MTGGPGNASPGHPATRGRSGRRLLLVLVGTMMVALAVVAAVAARRAEQGAVAARGEVILQSAMAGLDRVTVWSRIEDDEVVLTAMVVRQDQTIDDPTIDVVLLGLGPPQLRSFESTGDGTASLVVDRPDGNFGGQLRLGSAPMVSTVELVVPVPPEPAGVSPAVSLALILVAPLVAGSVWLAAGRRPAGPGRPVGPPEPAHRC